MNTESVERQKRRTKSFALLWSDVFWRNLLCKMLIYPLHCRLPPPPFKMWLFSDGQGNFDPLRLLWSKTPFHRSSTQEFKLILSPPTTTSLLGFGVGAKALPSCLSCWQPAELKALSNADDQCEWLTANGFHSHFFQGVGGCLILWDRNSSLFPFMRIMNFANCVVCSCVPLAFAETEWQPALCGSPFKVCLTVILAVFRQWISLDLRRYLTAALRWQRQSTVTAASPRNRDVIKESDNETETQEGVERCAHGLFRSDLKAPLLGDLFPVSTSVFSNFCSEMSEPCYVWVYLTQKPAS